MSKKTLKPVSFAVGTSFVATLAASNVSAETVSKNNPFAMSELSGGYMQLAYGGGGGGDKSDKKDKYGEGSCGGKKAKEEGKCGEGKCGEDKGKEGKCGEGKCGG